ncbi:MAG: HTTM domain-containing protein [Myxococcota bacterium]
MTTTSVDEQSRWKRSLRWLERPIDAAGLGVMRALLGVLLIVGTVRFMAQGWVPRLYEEPSYFFKYWGFSWVKTWPLWGMYLHYSALVGLAVLIAIGLYCRTALAAFALLFSYVQLIDVTNYLNHYYLLFLLLVILAFLPGTRVFSIDAWRNPEKVSGTVPAWHIYVLRFQLAVVYFFAALAKIGPDWLRYGQPLGIWLGARSDLPLIGPLLQWPHAPLAFAWGGFLYDLTIVAWLSWRRTRVLAYLTVLVFHGLTSMLFDIGMFPGIMIIGTTVFFQPAWPRRTFLHRWLPRLPETRAPAMSPPSAMGPRWRWTFVAVACHVVLQLGLPLRHWIYPGDVLWGEQGMRWSWRVMVREKDGAVQYRVRQRRTGREWLASPHDYLTWRQAHEMSGQPDLILQLAHHIGADFKRRGFEDIEVFADVKVSLNGRAAAPLIDPNLDLLQIVDGVTPATYLLPPPNSAPLHPKGMTTWMAKDSDS